MKRQKEEILTHVDHVLRNGGQSVFILLTPEALNRAANLRGFAQTAGYPVTIIFDEAHTIPSWGLEFRDELITVSETVRSLPGVQLVLASASISHPVVNFIERCYGVPMDNIVSHLYIRPNVSYKIEEVSALPRGHKSVEKFAESYPDVVGFLLDRFPQGSIIVFSENKKRVNALAAGLNGAGLPAVRFHSDLPPNVKTASLASWSAGEVRIMIATSAISLGVDNPHCVGTVHLGHPVSVYNFIQESGRVGRRRQPSLCIIVKDTSYTYNRMCSRIEQRQKKAGDDIEVRHILAGNSEILAWAATCGRRVCIPQMLLHFVNPNVGAEPCHRCSVCQSPAPQLPLQGFAIVLKALLKRTAHLQDKRKGCILSLAKFLSAANCSFASRNHLDEYPERSVFHNYDIPVILQMISLMIAHGDIKPHISIDPDTCFPTDIAFRE
nr:PREDICTED: putative ATP-dependent DNA helicase Q1 [Bemisia tabaci]